MTKKSANAYLALAAIFLFLAVFAGHARADVPRVISFQGKLSDVSGHLLNEQYSLTFRLYDAETGGTKLWEETHPGVHVTKGVFVVPLGAITPLDLQFDTAYWVSLEVGTDGEMKPRERLTAGPYAIRADTARVADSAHRSIVADMAETLNVNVQNGDMLYYQDGWKRVPAAPEEGMVLTSQAPEQPPHWTVPVGIHIYSTIGGSGGAGYGNFADTEGTAYTLPSGGPYTLAWEMKGSFQRLGGWSGSEGGRARAAVGSMIGPEASDLGTSFDISGVFTDVPGGSVFRMQSSGGMDNPTSGNPQLSTLGPTPTYIRLYWAKQ